MADRDIDHTKLPPRHCTKHRTDGQKCRAWALPGLDVCYFHGGHSPAAIDKTKRAQAIRSAQALYQTLGGEIDVDPVEGLLGEIRRTAGHIAWLGEQLGTSEVKDVAAGFWLYKRSTDSHITWNEDTERQAGDSFAGVWLELYMKERQHYVKVCEVAIRAGLEERRIRMAEHQAERLGQAITQMLRDLGINTGDPTVRAIAYRALTEASGHQAVEVVESV